MTRLRHHTLNPKHHNVRSNFSILRDALERCPHNSAALSGRDVGRVRSALAATIARRGRPDSPRHAEVRAMQAGLLALPTRRQIARELVDRLSRLAADGGIADPSELLAPAQPWSGQPVAVPPNLVRKVQRALDAPIEVLVERGIIGSAAVLASVLPQMSTQVLAAGDSQDDVASAVVTAALERIRRYPICRRPAHIATNVLLDTRQTVSRTLFKRQVEEVEIGNRPAEVGCAAREREAAAEVRILLDEARRRSWIATRISASSSSRASVA